MSLFSVYLQCCIQCHHGALTRVILLLHHFAIYLKYNYPETSEDSSFIVPYFALSTTCIKQEKARNPKISSDALINNDSPTEYFNFVLCLCLIPWDFNNNPEQHIIVRLRMNRNTISFVEYEKCDYERERGKKKSVWCPDKRRMLKQFKFRRDYKWKLEMKAENLETYYPKILFSNMSLEITLKCMYTQFKLLTQRIAGGEFKQNAKKEQIK